MKKETYRLLAALWILALVATRILYGVYGSHNVADTYGYYARAMIQSDSAGRTSSLLTMSSGIAYAYTRNLSGVLAFLGNRMDVLGEYQLFLQSIWMMALFIGVGLVFGRMAQMLTGTILAVSPWILRSTFVISPENYFMYLFSLLFLGLGLFCAGTKKSGAGRNVLWAAELALVSFGMGMLCIWNYLGWLLVPVAVFILVKNKEHFLYGGILSAGILSGLLATLLKYTGMTGLSLGEQFAWWLAPIKALPKRCQDLSIQMAGWLIFAGLAGILLAMITENIRQKKHESAEEGKEIPANADMEKTEEEKADGEEARFVTTKDGRQVALLDNPLPLPKKHEKKKMDFKYHDLPVDPGEPAKEWMDRTKEGDLFADFDVSIPDGDDFDI